MIQAILFDMDGVLLDSEAYGMQMLPIVAERYGYVVTPAIYRDIVGATNARSKEILKAHLGEAFPYDRVLEDYWALLLAETQKGRMPLKPGLAACLTGLRQRGLLLALVTSTQRPVVEAYLEAIPAFHGAFDVVVCGSDVARGKPAPDIYLRAAALLSVPVEGCLGVEDSLSGLKSLAAAGIPSVMIPDLQPYEEELQPLVTHLVASLEELCPLVDRLR